jgi:hypothetical protein
MSNRLNVLVGGNWKSYGITQEAESHAAFSADYTRSVSPATSFSVIITV